MSIAQKILEDKVFQVFKAIGVTIDKRKIDYCHILWYNKEIITKFLHCKDCKWVLHYKKDLCHISLTNLNYQKEPDINQGLCP